MEYHVAKTGSDQGQGTLQNPFLTINKAASLAMAGDTIIVHEGVYREWVKPRYKGLSDKRRIIYQAAEGEKVVIKGSEQVQTWQKVEGNVWKCELPNSFFSEFNPYKEEIFGDWLVTVDEKKHLGDVYLNGMSFYEVSCYEELIDPQVRTEVLDHWTQKIVPVHNPEQTKYVWFAEVDAENTTIYANFQGTNPNEEFVEINVRRSCFYPTETGIDYITVKGFEMAQAATPWAPPTANQPGLIGANWSKGWIIEDNIIHDAKCSAISIGKEGSTGHNYRSIRKDKPGYQYQLEAVFSAERNGWSKEKIGSHIIRNNIISDCGQNAIVGHLGCVFSEIYNNHIYNIALKREFYGHEIAGIKLHAAIDVQIHNNRIHDCSLGLWLDWQAQGTRVSKNLFYNNNRDLFVEVSHGPYMVDHNIMASEYAIDNISQGGAYINNLIAGKMNQQKVLNRSTQYHLPHSTKVAGFAFVYGGDDRFYNNIFIGADGLEDVGTSHYKNYTTSLEEYIENVNKKHGDLEEFELVEQPVYINKNAYFNGAEPFEREKDKLVDREFDPEFRIIDKGEEVYLSCQLPDSFEEIIGEIHSTKTLERVRIVDAEFENPDGSDLILDIDFLDKKSPEKGPIGPIAIMTKGNNYIKVW
ncbi:right-handed parallel beta-helix repeat-containing protein [Xylanivirga thermophila]|uniref:right-handed parallel beta-helix repeat-containing protein n=1 Tax=Xylanivirga thermophila TaxID=2496273 RepID=UPI00101C389E|nr:right-handed parallel beta-helix repeat-containing protein [Xylanivirga thermophila]